MPLTSPPIVGTLPIGGEATYGASWGGDPLRAAFRYELAVILSDTPAIPWPVRDLQNTTQQPAPPAADADSTAQGHFEIDFPGSVEAQYTFGAPGSNLHREQGQVTIRAVTRLRAGSATRDLAESYLATVRSRFRMRRFAVGSLSCRITDTAPMGGGQDEAGMWVESLALGYEIYNVG